MSFPTPNPPPTTYLQLSADSKTIDLMDLLRRLCAEYQYHDPSVDGNLVEMEKLKTATSNQRVLKLIERKLDASRPLKIPNLTWKQPRKQDVVKFLSQFPVTRYTFKGIENKWVTAKDFKYVKTTPKGCSNAEKLKDIELRRLYWGLRLIYADYGIAASLRTIIEELKKQKYAGLLLPTGKVVPFEALHAAVINFTPKELSLFEYSGEGFEESGDSSSVDYPPEIIELKSEFLFGPKGELICHHYVLALNLPEVDAQGKLGRAVVIDPTCVPFGMEGTNGELLYWGYYDDYVNAFPARKVNIYGPGNILWACVQDGDESYPFVLDVVKATLANLKFDSCGYCGDVPRKNENGEIKLKKCSRCMKVYYCDVLCQKMAWKGHKLECKPESK